MFCTVPIAIKKPEQGISFSVVLWASYSQNLSATIATNVLRKDLFQRANSFSMSIYLHFKSGRRLNSKRRITAEQLGFRLQDDILAFLSKQIIFVLTCETLVGFESPERKKRVQMKVWILKNVPLYLFWFLLICWCNNQRLLSYNLVFRFHIG